MPADYLNVLAELKQRIAAAQVRAARAVSRELVALYWHIGETIVQRQEAAAWGNSVVERLAHDLRKAFPDLKGFSPRNIWRMRAFFLAWSRGEKLTQPVSGSDVASGPAGPPDVVFELPWGHNIVLLQEVENPQDRLWYAAQVREFGWSRATLRGEIAKRTHERHGKATTNFARSLPSPQSELAQETLKDPYTFDFLTVGREAHERVTERELLAHIREFLLELGAGFAFMGNQVRLTVDDTDYFVDLLFYHVRLRCYVVVELKSTAFRSRQSRPRASSSTPARPRSRPTCRSPRAPSSPPQRTRAAPNIATSPPDTVVRLNWPTLSPSTRRPTLSAAKTSSRSGPGRRRKPSSMATSKDSMKLPAANADHAPEKGPAISPANPFQPESGRILSLFSVKKDQVLFRASKPAKQFPVIPGTSGATDIHRTT